ncbi:MAG: D-aminoacyl-tRNA deacylase [Congregibacter sp.]
MQALLQRVSRASVVVDGESVGAIDQGLLVFLGLEPEDDFEKGCALLERILKYRVLSDEEGRMNKSLRDIGGGLLLVSQFTLAADTQRGLRPSFSTAMPPADAESLFERILTYAKENHHPVASGRFGADMQVHLVNDGPVSFNLAG